MAIQNLRNKQVVITGAGSGIGRASALAFAYEGANIIATDLNADALDKLKQDVCALGVQCDTKIVDVSSQSAMNEFAQEVLGRAGAVDVLINNAGIVFLGQFLKSDLAHWRRILDVNLMGVVNGCHAFLPGMLNAGGERHVLNVASSAGNYPAPSMAAYAASKFAVMGFNEVLKMELANTSIKISTICPGVINTPIVAAHSTVSPSVSKAQLKRLRDYYIANGCSPDRVAEAMVRAVRNDHDMVMVGPYAKIMYYTKRISMKLARWLVLRSAEKVGYL